MSDPISSQLLSVILVLLCSQQTISSSNDNKVNIRLKLGEVIGSVETPIDGIRLNVFRGVPYAKPPIGSLRFRKPLPVEPWTQAVEALQFQSSCAQNAKLFEVETYLVNKNISEDCLYLNIWSPVDSKKNELLKPVMVWFHGGGYLVGGASEEYYQGDILAAKGDVVVVSLNYRVNTLGFLYTGREDAPGNMGLWDQALALEWVKDNIKYFGGDPNRITIFGESAGGWSVSLHILSPVSRHLFNNAIMNSGAYIYKFFDDKPEDHLKKWLRGAELIGCKDEDNDQEFTEKVMDCLRAADPITLASIVDMTELIPGSVKVFEFVVTDGEFLTQKPIDMLRSGDYKKNVNLMISTVEDEGAFLINSFNDPVKFDLMNPKKLTYSEAYNDLAEIATGMNCEVPINGQDVAKVYMNGFGPNTDYNLLLKSIGIAVGDYYLTCPTLLFGQEVFRNSGFATNVFQYYYNSKFEDNFFCSKWMGVCHTNDYFPMFGMPFYDHKHYNDREREISLEMMNFLTEFARNGDPGKVHGTQWEKYYTIDDNIITPFYEITNYPKNTTNFGLGLKLNECQYLWKKHLI